MRGERWALRAGEYLVCLACRRLPARIRQERYQEWLAELPVILRDRDTGPAPVRVARMLAFAADTLRGTALRGTALAADAYRGTHRGRGTAAKDIRWLGTGLLLLGALLVCALFQLACEGCIVYQLATGPHLLFSIPLVLVNLPWHGRGPGREIPLPARARRPGIGAAAWPDHELSHEHDRPVRQWGAGIKAASASTRPLTAGQGDSRG